MADPAFLPYDAVARKLTTFDGQYSLGIVHNPNSGWFWMLHMPGAPNHGPFTSEASAEASMRGVNLEEELRLAAYDCELTELREHIDHDELEHDQVTGRLDKLLNELWGRATADQQRAALDAYYADFGRPKET